MTDTHQDIVWVCLGSWEIGLPRQALEEGCHQGQCDEDVEYWEPRVDWDGCGMTPEQIRETLDGHGAWDDEQLADAQENRRRILWIAAGDYQDSKCAAD